MITDFLDAQDYLYATAIDELTIGKKESHWIWFIFPQMYHYKMSSISSKFAFKNESDVVDYIDNDILYNRLIECVKLVLSHDDKLLIDILVSELDVLKFKSSMSLFYNITKKEIFLKAISKN